MNALVHSYYKCVVVSLPNNSQRCKTFTELFFHILEKRVHILNYTLFLQYTQNGIANFSLLTASRAFDIDGFAHASLDGTEFCLRTLHYRSLKPGTCAHQ